MIPAGVPDFTASEYKLLSIIPFENLVLLVVLMGTMFTSNSLLPDALTIILFSQNYDN